MHERKRKKRSLSARKLKKQARAIEKIADNAREVVRGWKQRGEEAHELLEDAKKRLEAIRQIIDDKEKKDLAIIDAGIEAIQSYCRPLFESSSPQDATAIVVPSTTPKPSEVVPPDMSPLLRMSLSLSSTDHFDYLILDAEGITFDLGPSGIYQKTYTVIQEVAVVHISLENGRLENRLRYYAELEYDLAEVIENISKMRLGRYWGTALLSMYQSGCGKSARGVTSKKVISDIESIEAEYPNAKLWAKGPVIEAQLLSDLIGMPVVLERQRVHKLPYLSSIGCPLNFDELPKVMREISALMIDKGHLDRFHPNSHNPLCCISSCIAFGYWLANNWVLADLDLVIPEYAT